MSTNATASPTLALPMVPALDNTFGALLIGVLLSSALWGIGTAQVSWYYESSSKKDSIYLKAFVFTVWIFDTVHQALIGHIVYFFLIKNYFNPLQLDTYVWSLNVQSLFEALTCLFVQSFFLMRIWKLSRGNIFLTIIPGLPILAKFGLSLAYFGKSFRLPSIALAFTKIHNISVAINATAATGDILIAGTMVYILLSSRSGFSPTDTMISRLMAFTINTGLITSMCAILALITALTFPKNFIYSAFYFLTGRLYLNTMLGSLNARANIAKAGAVFSAPNTGRGTTDIEIPVFKKRTEAESSFSTATRANVSFDSHQNKKGISKANESYPDLG